jgi:molybdate transport system ATP-binding protein
MSLELQIHYKKHMTCLEVVCSGFFDSIGLYRSCTEPQVLAAKKWMTVLGITDLEAQFFPRISEGLQRLILIARALVKSPDLLVLDEPCQGLDRDTRKKIIGLIDQVCQKTDATLLYVTHDLEELPGVITHVLTLDGGRITGCGERKKSRQDW